MWYLHTVDIKSMFNIYHESTLEAKRNISIELFTVR